jgi:stage II sporulation protein AB (anti-sigma F factor)
LDFTLSEIEEIKVAVSEAVSNAIIHGYNQEEGMIEISLKIDNQSLIIKVEDHGIGIANVKQACEPAYTTADRMGLGLVFIDSFMNEFKIDSTLEEGTRIKMIKIPEKSKKKAKEAPKKEAPAADDAVLSRLETRGVMEADDQNYVLRFAKAEGISPIEALSDPIVIDRMKANEKTRTSVDATPRSNNRANTTQDEVAVAVKKFEQSGELPDGNPALTAKILKRLSNRG